MTVGVDVQHFSGLLHAEPAKVAQIDHPRFARSRRNRLEIEHELHSLFSRRDSVADGICCQGGIGMEP